MNPMEMLRELWAGIVYIFRKWRGKETDKLARRVAAHQSVFGHSRSRVLSDGSAQNESLIRNGQEKKRDEKRVNPLSRVEPRGLDEVMVEVEREVFLGSERQWLGVEDNHDYILGSITREKSEGFEDAVAKELYTRGYTLRGRLFPAFPTLDTKLTIQIRGRQAQVRLQRRRRRAGSRSGRKSESVVVAEHLPTSITVWRRGRAGEASVPSSETQIGFSDQRPNPGPPSDRRNANMWHRLRLRGPSSPLDAERIPFKSPRRCPTRNLTRSISPCFSTKLRRRSPIS